MADIRIPQGMRDLTFEECEKKRYLQMRIEEVFRKFGYREIMTPAVEFYSTYADAFQDSGDEEFYKFFDQDGRILTLREDMTVPIARVCASKLANSEPPYRLSYCSDVFKVRHVFGGRRSEVTDCGIELIGLDQRADLEVLYTALAVMSVLDTENYQLEIGNSRFFRSAVEDIGIDAEAQRTLADLIDRKSLVDLDTYLDSLSLSEQASEFFRNLPLLGGGAEALEAAKTYAFSPGLCKEVETLCTLYEQLSDLGAADHISFDFGKVPHLDYYTGIIFEGYVASSGTSVLSGGRYDKLLGKFGRDLPACGFSVKLDYLLDSVKVSEGRKCRLMYPYGKEKEALLKAQEMRKEFDVEMIPWESEEMEVQS